MSTAKIVTQAEFFNVIGKLDVTLYPEGKYPYKTLFKSRRGDVIGYIQDYVYGGFVIPIHYLLKFVI